MVTKWMAGNEHGVVEMTFKSYSHRRIWVVMIEIVLDQAFECTSYPAYQGLLNCWTRYVDVKITKARVHVYLSATSARSVILWYWRQTPWKTSASANEAAITSFEKLLKERVHHHMTRRAPNDHAKTTLSSFINLRHPIRNIAAAYSTRQLHSQRPIILLNSRAQRGT
jgi:hypothetical protein